MAGLSVCHWVYSPVLVSVSAIRQGHLAQGTGHLGPWGGPQKEGEEESAAWLSLLLMSPKNYFRSTRKPLLDKLMLKGHLALPLS